MCVHIISRLLRCTVYVEQDTPVSIMHMVFHFVFVCFFIYAFFLWGFYCCFIWSYASDIHLLQLIFLWRVVGGWGGYFNSYSYYLFGGGRGVSFCDLDDQF